MDEEHILELKRNFLSIKQLRNQSIIKYHALYFDLRKGLAYLVMEYFPYPNLSELKTLEEEVIVATRRPSGSSLPNSCRPLPSFTRGISAIEISSQRMSSLMPPTGGSRSSISASPRSSTKEEHVETC